MKFNFFSFYGYYIELKSDGIVNICAFFCIDFGICVSLDFHLFSFLCLLERLAFLTVVFKEFYLAPKFKGAKDEGVCIYNPLKEDIAYIPLYILWENS